MWKTHSVGGASAAPRKRVRQARRAGTQLSQLRFGSPSHPQLVLLQPATHMHVYLQGMHVMCRRAAQRTSGTASGSAQKVMDYCHARWAVRQEVLRGGKRRSGKVIEQPHRSWKQRLVWPQPGSCSRATAGLIWQRSRREQLGAGVWRCGCARRFRRGRTAPPPLCHSPGNGGPGTDPWAC